MLKACHKGFNPEYEEEGPTIDQLKGLAGFAVLEFGAPWCGHCRAALPAIKAVLSERALPHIKIFDGPGKPLGRSFKVKLWPTLILLQSGVEVARLVRPVDVKEVTDLLSSVDH
tara:strand:- start:173 stop:514 length:342 start_codon:yes stop_codon:yes gene_type:complete